MRNHIPSSCLCTNNAQYALCAHIWASQIWGRVVPEKFMQNAIRIDLASIGLPSQMSNVSDDHGLLLQVVLAVHGVVYNQLTCADCLQKCWKYEKTHMSTTITTEYHSLVNENFNLCDTSYVRYLPGLLLLVVLAVHSAVDHETTWAKIRQVGYPWKGLSKNILVLQSSCLWVRWGGKEPNLQNLPLAAFYHFGASWKAVVARSVTLEQRQIEGWSWWQNWPILCALQLCCWVEDLISNSLGSRPAFMKM